MAIRASPSQPFHIHAPPLPPTLPSYLPTLSTIHIPVHVYRPPTYPSNLIHSFQTQLAVQSWRAILCCTLSFTFLHFSSLQHMIAGRYGGSKKQEKNRSHDSNARKQRAASLRVRPYTAGVRRAAIMVVRQCARAKNEPRLIVPTIGSKLHGKANRHRSPLHGAAFNYKSLNLKRRR